MNRILRAAVIGLGVGEAHVQGYFKHPNCRVVAICDSNEDVLENRLIKYPNCTGYRNAINLLNNEQLDVVSIASYDDAHFEQIIAAIDNDIHLFIEKPICIKEEHAIEIWSKLKEKPNIKISSNLILRKTPRFVAVKKAISAGDFGDLFAIEGDYTYGRLHKILDGWRGAIPGYSGVFGGGVHLVDLFLWLTQQRPVRVAAFGNSISTASSGFKNYDLVTSILHFESGMVGKMSVNLGSITNHFHPFRLYGTKQTFINQEVAKGIMFTNREPNVEYHELEDEYPGTHKGDLIEGFIESILEDHEPVITKNNIFDAMAVCFAIEQAVHSKKVVEINYFDS